MEPALIDFIASLDACRTFDEAWAATLVFFEAEGQPWICYGYVKPRAAGDGIEFRWNIPQAYQDQWVEEGLAEVDPTIRLARSSVLPEAFGVEFLDPERHGERVYRYYASLREIGGRSSLAVPLRATGNVAGGFIELLGDRSRSDFESYMKSHGGRLLAAAHYANVRMLELLGAEGLSEVRLSPRETECLHWLSAGHMNERIAERMGVSVATVRLHLTNARRKLKAATREQALVRALKLGLLQV